MKKFNLQLFADATATAEAVQGKKIIYLFRPLKDAATKNAVAMAFTTENERTKSKDADSTATKDGNIRTPGATETEITATALLKKGDDLAERLEDAMDDDELIEVWEANLDEPGSTEGTFKGRYYQSYLTEFALASSAEDHAEYSTTFAVNGKGAKGDVTVTAEQQELANYVFRDTQKTGA
jgi:TP901-1 family phage major tail protein